MNIIRPGNTGIINFAANSSAAIKSAPVNLIGAAIIMILAALALTSCASPRVQMDVLIPAESVEASQERQIAVLPFINEKTQKEMEFSAFESMLTSIRVDGQAYFKVITRSQLDKIISELELGQSGLIDEKQAAQVGKMAGVSAVYVGAITNDGTPVTNDSLSQREDCRNVPAGKNKTRRECKQVPQYCKEAVSSFSFIPKLIKVETAQILFSEEFKGRRSDKKCIDKTNLQTMRIDEASLISASREEAISKMRVKIAPYKMTVNIPLMDDEEGIGSKQNVKKLESALEFFKAKRSDRACSILEDLVKKEKNSPSILYNMGVCQEVKGDYDGALDYYKKADKQTSKPEDAIGQGIKRIETRKEESERLKKQMG